MEITKLTKKEVEELNQLKKGIYDYKTGWVENQSGDWVIKPIDDSYRYCGTWYGSSGNQGTRVDCGMHADSWDSKIKFPEKANLWLVWDRERVGKSDITDLSEYNTYFVNKWDEYANNKVGVKRSSRVINFRYVTPFAERSGREAIPYNHTLQIDTELFDKHFAGDVKKLKAHVDGILEQIVQCVEPDSLTKLKWQENVKPEEACRGATALNMLWYDSQDEAGYANLLFPYVARALSSIEPVEIKSVCPVSKEKFYSWHKSNKFYTSLDEMKGDADMQKWLLEELGISETARAENQRKLAEAQKLLKDVQEKT